MAVMATMEMVEMEMVEMEMVEMRIQMRMLRTHKTTRCYSDCQQLNGSKVEGLCYKKRRQQEEIEQQLKETTVGNNRPINDRILKVRMMLEPIWLVTMRRMVMKEHFHSAISVNYTTKDNVLLSVVTVRGLDI
ncbi:hypothetical protein Tco_1118822 [Tanacetum coccineum]